MKKIVASVGLVTLGATALQAQQSVPGITTEMPKPWSISATLRGFYDDNINATPNKQDAFGYEVSPSALINWAMEQTALNLSYVFSAKYYDHNLEGQTSKWRYTHNITFGFDHAFSERYQLSVRDSFVIGQEPDFLRAGNTFNTFQPVSGNNLRNYGVINFDAKLSREFGLEVGYINAYTDYAQSGTGDPGTDAQFPSNAGLLNRIENYAHIDGRWQALPETVVVLGYQYSQWLYTGNEAIGTSPFTASGFVYSDARNNRSQYGYLGVDQTFRPDLTASLRAGARYNDYYNDPTSQNHVSPYVMAQLSYVYAVESSLTAGFSYDLTATDVFSVDQSNGQLTLDANAATFWVNLSQRLMPKVYGNLVGQFQNNTFNGGANNGDTQRFWLLGLNLQYRFNPHFSTEVGYDFDDLNSDIPNQSYSRNRVYIGLTASY